MTQAPITAEAFCECKSWCMLSIEIPAKETLVRLTEGLVLIVDGCPHGPEAGDVLVEVRDGYALYREGAARAGRAE